MYECACSCNVFVYVNVWLCLFLVVSVYASAHTPNICIDVLMCSFVCFHVYELDGSSGRHFANVLVLALGSLHVLMPCCVDVCLLSGLRSEVVELL